LIFVNVNGDDCGLWVVTKSSNDHDNFAGGYLTVLALLMVIYRHSSWAGQEIGVSEQQ